MYTRLATALGSTLPVPRSTACTARRKSMNHPSWAISGTHGWFMVTLDVWTDLNPCLSCLWTIEWTIFLKVRILRKSPTLPQTCPWHPATCWISKPKPAKNYQVSRLNCMEEKFIHMCKWRWNHRKPAAMFLYLLILVMNVLGIRINQAGCPNLVVKHPKIILVYLVDPII